MVLRQNGKKLIWERLLASRSYVSFTRIASRFKHVGTRAVLAAGTAGGGAAAPAGKLCQTEVWDQSWAASHVPRPQEHPSGPARWEVE